MERHQGWRQSRVALHLVLARCSHHPHRDHRSQTTRVAYDGRSHSLAVQALIPYSYSPIGPRPASSGTRRPGPGV